MTEPTKSAEKSAYTADLCNRPSVDSLWSICFHIVAERNRTSGVEVIKFCDVDDLVIEKSKLPADELKRFIGS